MGEDGSLVLADTFQWQDSGGVCAKYSWYQDSFILFIYLINIPELESSAMWEGPFLEPSLGAPLTSPEVKSLQPQLSPCFGLWLM